MKTVALLLVMSVPAFGQLVEHPPFRMFYEFPQAERRGYAIGNLGFDALMNVYNPHYDSLHAGEFCVFAGTSGVLGGRRTYPPRDERTTEIEADKFSSPLVPSFGLVYLSQHFMFQFSYYEDFCFSDQVTNGSTTYDFENLFTVSSHERTIRIRQNTARADFSAAIVPGLSLTVGLLTRDFRYDWDIKSIPTVSYTRNLFDIYQVFFGVEAIPWHDLKTYLVFTSMNPRIRLSGGEFRFPTGIYLDPGPKELSYFGTIGYGVQVPLLTQLKLSLEMRHLFLEDESDDLVAGSNGYTVHADRHIWNNEVTVGANVPINDDAQVGFRYSRFLKYDNRKGIIFTSLSGANSTMAISSPYSLEVSAQVPLGDFLIAAGYQLSGAKYLYLGQTLMSDNIHEAWLLLGYNFSTILAQQ